MSKADSAITTNVVRLPTAALTPPPRPRCGSKLRKEMIWRGEVIDLSPYIYSEPSPAFAPMDEPEKLIWIQVPQEAWEQLQWAARLLVSLKNN